MQAAELTVYQGQFGEFTITESDRRDVVIYRGALMVAALCFALGSALALNWGQEPIVLQLLTALYAVFCLALGVALSKIHIYLVVLHRALQTFWAIGCITALGVALYYPQPLVAAVYEHPITLLGTGFTFAALTGIFFKEAFCFNRLETKILTIIVPLLLLGHLIGKLSPLVEQVLLIAWVVLFFIFALRKVFQAIPPDIGDKSVFEYLKAQRSHA